MKRVIARNLIWQSADQSHLLIHIPSENVMQGADSFYFLRLSKDVAQIQIEMRFKNSKKLPWLSAEYCSIPASLNPLAEAIVCPAVQYRQARTQKNKSEIEKFHVIAIRLHDRILKEMTLTKKENSAEQAGCVLTAVCTDDLKYLLDALDDLDS
jgi:hypothetical protein